MRILYVFHSLAVWGGIERVLVDKMNHLAKMYDDEVFMLTTDQGNHSMFSSSISSSWSKTVDDGSPVVMSL